MAASTRFAEWLASRGAARDFVAWAESTGLEWPAVYEACPRADLVLAIAVRAGVDRPRLVQAARALALRAVDELEDDRISAAVSALVAADSRDAYAELARRLDHAADGAEDLVLAHGLRVLGLAAGADADPEASLAIPGLAVEIALASVMDCAMTSVVGSLQDELATLARQHLPAASVPFEA